MFDKLKAFLNLFRKGSEVANVEAWKTGQITSTVLGALILAIINVAQIYGVALPVDVDAANAIGGGIVAIVNIMLTAATSKRAGILPANNSAAEQLGNESDSDVGAGMPNGNIADDTRKKALRFVNNANNPLAGLDTTYSHR